MPVGDLAAAHILRGAQLLIVTDGEKALADLRPLGEGRERAVLFEHLAALFCLGRVDRAAGEHADRQHRAVDDEHAALLVFQELQQLFAVPGAVNIGDVGLFGDVGAHRVVRAHVGHNKKPLNALSHQLVDHPREDGAEQNGPEHQRRFLFCQGHIVRHEQDGQFLIHWRHLLSSKVVLYGYYIKENQKIHLFSQKRQKLFSLWAAWRADLEISFQKAVF